MSKRVQLTDIREDEEDQDLKDIIEKYIKKSEQLEKRESNVLKQVELVQSAVASLQSWDRKVPSTTSHSVHISVGEIEEESKKIKEETERIQKEVIQKIKENKKLQDEIERRKWLDRKEEDELGQLLNEEEGIGGKEIESRMKETHSFLEDDSNPEIQSFNDELQKRREMSRAFQKKSELQERKKINNFENASLSKNEKVNPKIDKELIATWRGKLEKK